MARAWPRAAQYKSTAFFNRAIFLVIPLQISWHVKSELDYCKTHIRGQEGTRTLDQLIKSQLLYQLSYLPDIAHWKYNFLKSKKKIFVFVAPPAATPSRFGCASFLGGQTRSAPRNNKKTIYQKNYFPPKIFYRKPYQNPLTTH